MEIAILGGGTVGLGLALNLKQRGVACRVYERVPEVRELGVGITLLPHYIDELRALSDRYKRVAGYSIEELGRSGS
jgi:2-polyprenyl-6-methoxyphenol hydroxylase-like FAD-dependent oxidoreductase